MDPEPQVNDDVKYNTRSIDSEEVRKNQLAKLSKTKAGRSEAEVTKYALRTFPYSATYSVLRIPLIFETIKNPTFFFGPRLPYTRPLR